LGLALPTNIRQGYKGMTEASDKHPGLVSDEEKKFYNLNPRRAKQ